MTPTQGDPNMSKEARPTCHLARMAVEQKATQRWAILKRHLSAICAAEAIWISMIHMEVDLSRVSPWLGMNHRTLQLQIGKVLMTIRNLLRIYIITTYRRIRVLDLWRYQEETPHCWVLWPRRLQDHSLIYVKNEQLGTYQCWLIQMSRKTKAGILHSILQSFWVYQLKLTPCHSRGKK